MAKVFISFMGLGNPRVPDDAPGYAPVVYEWQDQKMQKTPLAQAAMVEALGPRDFDRLVFFFTKESREKHASFLKRELERLGVEEDRIKFCERDIPVEMTPDNQWDWFENLLNSVNARDRVTFDFTHGMRAVPIVFSSAIAFLEKAKDIEVEHVLYAFYDGPGAPSDPVKPPPASTVRDSFPIIEMRDFYVLNQWAEAVSRLSEDADARKLAELATTSEVTELQILRDPEFITALQRMTDCIRNVDVNHVAAAVSAALDIVNAKRESCKGTARLLLDLVWEKYKGLAFEHPLSGHYDQAYFESQMKIIETLLEHRLFMQAFTAIRECLASIGLIGLPEKYQNKMESNKGKSQRYRFADVFAVMIQLSEDTWAFSGDRHQCMLTLKPWWEHLKTIGCSDLIKTIGGKNRGKLFDYRNGFDHAWTMVPIVEISEFELAGKTYLATLHEILEILNQHKAFFWRPPTEEDLATPVFLNLSNHPIVNWSETQLQAARALKHGEPMELPGGMPKIAPQADEKEISTLAAELASRVHSLGAKGAFVASDFTFAFQLIQQLKKLDIHCYATTSERRTQETPAPDGTTRKVTEFQFVRWREYK